MTSAKSYSYTTAEAPSGGVQNSFSYDTIYKDRLKSFGVSNFVYNSIGYPVSIGNKRLEWDNGRLVSYYDEGHGEGSSSTESFEFTYNAYGQRTVKEYSYYPGEDYYDDYVTGSTTTYTYDHSGRLIREYCTERYYASSNVTREFIYLYDETGIVGAMYSYNGGTAQPYYYHRNQRGDVVAIYDSNGIKRAEYAYDAFGNCKIVNSSNNDLANKNPIRYRGYYYDTESGFYYLNARYYNPVWRRFISPDSTEYLDPQTINGLNQYAYCNNDPVNYVDPSGHSVIASFLIGFAISSLVGWGLSEILGSKIAGGIGSVGGGTAAVSTGINLCAFGPWGIAAGIALMAVGGLTVALGINEIVDGTTGTNYIQNWFGWSDNVYNGVYISMNIASAVGSIAGNISMRFASNQILNTIVQDPSKINNYKLGQIRTFGEYSSVYSPGTLKRGSHVGQGYTLTHNENASLGYIQWHPGGGHHGPLAYWKITSSFNKAARFYYLTGLPF